MAGQSIGESTQTQWTIPADESLLRYLVVGTLFAVCVLCIELLVSGEPFTTGIITQTGADVFGTVTVLLIVLPIGSLMLIGAAATFGFERYRLYTPLLGSGLLLGTIALLISSAEITAAAILAAPIFMLPVGVGEYYFRHAFIAERSALIIKTTGIVILYTGYVSWSVLWPLVGRQTPWLLQLTPYRFIIAIWFLFGLYLAIIGISTLFASKLGVYMPLCIGSLWLLFELTYLHGRVGAGDFAFLLYVFCGPLVAVATVGAGLVEHQIYTRFRQ